MIEEQLKVPEASEPSAGSTSAEPAAHGECRPTAENRLVMILEPPRRWQLINVRELWQFRELVFFLAWRDVKVRYKQTALGVAWAVLQPVMMMVVFTIFFGRIGGMASTDSSIPYSVFVYAGLLPWTFFSTGIVSAGNSVVGSERLITKVYFPRLAVPFASVGAAIVDCAIAFVLLLILMVFNGIELGVSLLLVPLFLSLVLLAALGVGTLLAALNVAYRDFRYVIPFLVQIWMFATPTVYMQPKGDSTSSVLRFVLALNPLTSVIGAFRAAALGGTIAWGEVAVSAASIIAVFVIGCLYFRKVEDGLADII
jgi:lipopolysaccharide transport system permease protein